MSERAGPAFQDRLRGQLNAKKLTQRQLGQQSGVDHSTISRLIRGERLPNLGTATKLARGLQEVGAGTDMPLYFGGNAPPSGNPTARVEYSLRADTLMNERQVRQVMEYYLALRMQRLATRHRPNRRVLRPVPRIVKGH